MSLVEHKLGALGRTDASDMYGEGRERPLLLQRAFARRRAEGRPVMLSKDLRCENASASRARVVNVLPTTTPSPGL